MLYFRRKIWRQSLIYNLPYLKTHFKVPWKNIPDQIFLSWLFCESIWTNLIWKIENWEIALWIPIAELLRIKFGRIIFHVPLNPFHAIILSVSPENIRKPVVFWCFQGVQKETSGMKWDKNQFVMLQTNLSR